MVEAVLMKLLYVITNTGLLGNANYSIKIVTKHSLNKTRIGSIPTQSSVVKSNQESIWSWKGISIIVREETPSWKPKVGTSRAQGKISNKQQRFMLIVARKIQESTWFELVTDMDNQFTIPLTTGFDMIVLDLATRMVTDSTLIQKSFQLTSRRPLPSNLKDMKMPLVKFWRFPLTTWMIIPTKSGISTVVLTGLLRKQVKNQSSTLLRFLTIEIDQSERFEARCKYA